MIYNRFETEAGVTTKGIEPGLLIDETKTQVLANILLYITTCDEQHNQLNMVIKELL